MGEPQCGGIGQEKAATSGHSLEWIHTFPRKPHELRHGAEQLEVETSARQQTFGDIPHLQDNSARQTQIQKDIRTAQVLL